MAELGLLSGCGIPFPRSAKAHRVGFLIGSPRSAIAARTEAFEQGLRELGYVEGKDIVIEWRSWRSLLGLDLLSVDSWCERGHSGQFGAAYTGGER